MVDSSRGVGRDPGTGDRVVRPPLRSLVEQSYILVTAHRGLPGSLSTRVSSLSNYFLYLIRSSKKSLKNTFDL